MVRSGSRASSRKIAVASKPMNPAMANIRPRPGEPERISDGWNIAVDRPSGPPPLPTTNTSSSSTIPTSAISRTASTLLDSSMRR